VRGEVRHVRSVWDESVLVRREVPAIPYHCFDVAKASDLDPMSRAGVEGP